MMALVSAMSLTFFSSTPLEGHAAKIREFWESTARLFAARGDVARGLVNQVSAGVALAHGANAFFAPRMPAPWLQPAGTVEATGYYDSAQLKATLENLVDFDRINAAEMRFSVGAVNVSSGNFVYFDNATHVIGPEHVMASCALPHGFPPVEIEGECYGGIVSNTPLQWVLESEPRQDTLAFQVDLWSARGAIPRNMAEVETRRKASIRVGPAPARISSNTARRHATPCRMFSTGCPRN
jgi:NTE family protein